MPASPRTRATPRTAALTPITRWRLGGAARVALAGESVLGNDPAPAGGAEPMLGESAVIAVKGGWGAPAPAPAWGARAPPAAGGRNGAEASRVTAGAGGLLYASGGALFAWTTPAKASASSRAL